MAKFTSYDGVDSQGVRAEVVVQTGSGRIKEVTPKSSANANGSYRIYEVVFDPDNPHLKRKVYANLDSTSQSLYEKVLESHKSGQTVEYRIESVRKRGVDRTKPFAELEHTEEAVRILAAIDDVFADEARTDPSEDPNGSETPSALKQRQQGSLPPVGSFTAGEKSVSFNPEVAEKFLVEGFNFLPAKDVIANLQAGMILHRAENAGLTNDEIYALVLPFLKKAADSYGSPQMELMISLESFALNLLMKRYALQPGEVADQVFVQASAVAEEILRLTDRVHNALTPPPSNGSSVYDRAFLRMTDSYRNVLKVVQDTIYHKEGVPVFDNEQDRDAWRNSVVNTAQERLEMMLLIVSNKEVLVPHDEPLPLSTVSELTENVNGSEKFTSEPDEETPNSTVESAVLESSTSLGGSNANPDADLESLGGTVIFEYPDFKTVQGQVIPPSAEVISELKELCETANVLGDNKAIGAWLNYHLGHASVQNVNGENLERFLAFYKNEGPEKVRTDVLSFKSL